MEKKKPESIVTTNKISFGHFNSEEQPESKKPESVVTTNKINFGDTYAAIQEKDASVFAKQVTATQFSDAKSRAKAAGIAKRMKIDNVDFVQQNLSDYEAADKRKQFEDYVKLNPAIREMDADKRDEFLKRIADEKTAAQLYRINNNLRVYGQEDRPFAPVAFAKKIAYSWQKGKGTVDIGRDVAEIMKSRRLSEYEERQLLNAIKEEQKESPALASNLLSKLFYMGAETLPYTLKTGIWTFGGEIAATGASMALKRYPAVAVASKIAGRAVGAIGAFKEGEKIEAGNLYLDLMTMKDDDGNVIDSETCRNAAEIYGKVSAAIETAGTEILTGVALKANFLKRSLLKKQIVDLAKKKELKHWIAEFGKRAVVADISEAMEEGLQEGASIFAENRAKSAANRSGADFELADYAERVMDATIAGAQGAAVISVAGAGSGTIISARENRKMMLARSDKAQAESVALADKAVFDEMQKDAEQALSVETKEDVARNKQFFQKAFRSSLYDNVYLEIEDAEAFLSSDVYQTNKEWLDEIGFTDLFNKKIALAKDVSGVVSLSAADFATYITPKKEIYSEFTRNMKTSEDGMKFGEAEERAKQRVEILKRGEQLKREKEGAAEFLRKYFDDLYDGAALQRKTFVEYMTKVALTFSERLNMPVRDFVRAYHFGGVLKGYTGEAPSVSAYDEILSAIRDEIRSDPEEAVRRVSEAAAKKDIRAIRNILSKKIENANRGDIKKFIRLANAIRDMKLDLSNMTDDQIQNALNNFTTAPDQPVAPEAETSAETGDLFKASGASKAESALKDIQETGGDYVVIGSGRVPVAYEVRDISTINTSHTAEGAINPNYPQRFQPRDRSDIASREQIQNIVSSFMPERVGVNAVANEGAPIIDANGNVLVGNGRAMAISEVLKNPEKAAAYKEYIKSLGYLSDMENPILVRRLTGDMTDKQLDALVADANASGTMRYSVAEQALTDASKMTPNLLNALDVDADIGSAANKEFVKGVFNDVIPSGERNGLMVNGQITQDGIERIEDALVAMIVQDKALLDTLLTKDATGKNDNRKIASGLAKAAPAVLYFENEIENKKTIDPAYSIADDVRGAVYVLKRAIGKKMPLNDYLAQMDFLEGGVSASVQYIARIFDTMPNAAEVRNRITDYIRLASTEGDLMQGGLFATPSQTKEQILQAVSGGFKAHQWSMQKQNAEKTDTATAEDAREVAEQKASESKKDREIVAEVAKESAKTESAKKENAKEENGIQDFGEKIEGARKDVWAAYCDKLSGEMSGKKFTLAEAFPEPNYETAIAGGVPTDVLATIKAIRDSIPRKPTYGGQRWADMVLGLRKMASELLADKDNYRERFEEKINNDLKVKSKISLYRELGYPAFLKAKEYHIEKLSVQRFKGVDFGGYKDGFSVYKGYEALSFFTQYDEAVNSLRDLLTKELNKKKEAADIHFDVFRSNEDKSIFIGKKISSGKVVKIKTGFEKAKDAFAFISEHYDDVLSEYNRLKEQSNESRLPENKERTGKNYREGGNVTPNVFIDEFGFRGVQFGNWVNQKERQDSLNKAYDALLDLTGVLNIPARAVALDGTLGLAFGARGQGAAGSKGIVAAAHYERGEVVINLTKKRGAGSLAHEWFHALDNYFGQDRNINRESTGGFYASEVSEKTQQRREIKEAFSDLMKTISESPVFKRSSEKDTFFKTNYYSVQREIAARCFENYVKEKAAEAGIVNDYLVNIISRNKVDKESLYEYPTREEQALINAAFDKLFSVMKAEETEKGIKLYQSAYAEGRTDYQKNSLGRRISKTEAGRNAFNEWFGNSKVVNKSGQPLVVYHGTDFDFSEFRMGGGIDFPDAAYFSSKKTVAKTYTSREKVLDVYLKIENPYITNADGQSYNDFYDHLVSDMDYAARNGYDGVIVRNVRDDWGQSGKGGAKADTYIVFNPEQIKAVDNSGSFDRDNANIYYQPQIANDIRNKSVRVFDLSESVTDIPTKEMLTDKIKELLKHNPIKTQTVNKLVDFKEDGERDIVGHIVDSSRKNQTQSDIARRNIALNSIEDLIKNSVFIEKEKNKKPWKKNVEEYYRFYVPVLLGKGNNKKIYTVRIVAEKWKGEEDLKSDTAHLYDVILEEKTRQAEKLSSTPNGVFIKVSQMLSGVKGFDGTEYRQAESAAPFGAYDPIRRQITIFENSNLSTIIHESGHFWYDVFKDIVKKEGVNDQLRKDYATLDKWLTAEAAKRYTISKNETTNEYEIIRVSSGAVENSFLTENDAINATKHECFARGLEAYFRDFDVPVAGLRRIFSMFRRWLMGVYRSAKSLDIKIIPPVREVFDRMIATDEEILEYQSAVQMKKILDKSGTVLMTDEDFEKYAEMFKEASDISRENYMRAQAEVIAREQTRQFKERKEQIREREREEKCRTDKKFLIDTVLMLGKVGDVEYPNMTLDEEEVTRAFKQINVKRWRLRSNGKPIYKAGGMKMSEVAEFFGVTVDEVADAVFHINQNLDNFEKELTEIVHEELGDPVSAGDILERLRKANTTDVQQTILLTELSALTGSETNTTMLDRVMKNWAEDRVGKMKLRELKPQTFQRYALRAQDKAVYFAQRKNTKEAARWKERQIRNFYLQRECERQLDVAQKSVKRLQEIGKFKKEVNRLVEQTHQDAARALLARFGLAISATQAAEERTAHLAEFVQAQAANGYDIALPDQRLLEMKHTNYRDLTVDDFMTIRDCVLSIIYNGKQIKEFELEGEKIRKDEAIQKIAAALSGRKSIKRSATSNKPLSETVSKKLREWDSALLSLGGLAQMVDGADMNGIFHRLYLRPLTEAQNLEFYLNEKYAAKVGEQMKKLPSDVKEKLLDVVDGSEEMLGQAYNMEDLISFGLNMGTYSNLQRLKDGNKFGDSALQWIRDTIPLEAWDFIQGVWDVLDEMRPMLQEHQKKMSGLDMDEVIAVPFMVGNREFRGGYYPIVYDYSAFSEARKANSTAEALLESDYGRPTTATGYTKARADKVRMPVKTGFGVLTNHIQSVVHDVAYRKTLRDLWNITTDQAFIEVFDDKIGVERREALQGLLKSIGNKVNRDNRELKGVENTLKNIRNRATFIGLAYRLSSALAQLPGLASSVAWLSDVGKKSGAKHGGAYWIAKGCRDIINADVRQWIADKSGEVKARLSTGDQNLSERIRALRGKDTLRASIETYGYWFLGRVDFLVSLATWKGAYEQAINDLGYGEQDAIFYADRAMNESQGSGNVKETVAFQRGSEFMKMASMFYTPFAAEYQLNKRLFNDLFNVKDLAGFTNVFSRALALYLVSGCLGDIIAGNAPDKDESWLAWAIKSSFNYMIGAYPVLRDISSIKFGSAGKMPYGRWFDNAANSIKQIEKAMDGNATVKTSVRAAMTTLAYGDPIFTNWFVPISGQMIDTTGYLSALIADEVKPKSFSDILLGLYKGRERK